MVEKTSERMKHLPSGGIVLLVLGLAGGLSLRLQSMQYGWFTDFGVLHLGGRLVGEGRPADAYDPVRFLVEADALEPGGTADGWVALFISPPTFAWFMVPFGQLDERTSSLVWLAAGAVGMVAATRLLRLPLWVGAVAAVTPAGLATIFLGQTGLLAVFALAVLHRCIVSERRVAAGLVVAAMVVKPPLVVGVVLWWLVDWRRWWPALASAAGGSAILLALTMLDGGEAWRWFLVAMGERSEIEHDIWYNQATVGELVKRIGGAGLDPLVVTAGGLVVAAAVLWWAHSRLGGTPTAMSGLATLVTLVASPHLLHYDMVIALVAVGAAVEVGWERRRVEFLAGSLVFVVAYGQILDLVQRELFGLAVAVLPVGVITLIIVWSRWMASPTPSDDSQDRSDQRVLVDA